MSTEKQYTMADVYKQVYEETGILPVHCLWLDDQNMVKGEMLKRARETKRLMMLAFEEVDKERGDPK
ncbi:hypothetical protein [Limosilactobacillus mucosae]|uniref:hypothetical protein n=1 Tax=Limosilactobacillus mucosae TaxID=97478 RepID=UPI0006527A74|nr:hypothetical protein [Limosilactobacillus mucosae]HAM86055.1 hypothetical protein [Lactobacillus sp.]